MLHHDGEGRSSQSHPCWGSFAFQSEMISSFQLWVFLGHTLLQKQLMGTGRWDVPMSPGMKVLCGYLHSITQALSLPSSTAPNQQVDVFETSYLLSFSKKGDAMDLLLSPSQELSRLCLKTLKTTCFSAICKAAFNPF